MPGCQDTGTAIIMGKKGHLVLTEGDDDLHLSNCAYDAYTKLNLRYSQVAPINMFEEKNTGTNLPAQIDLYSNAGDFLPKVVVVPIKHFYINKPRHCSILARWKHS